MKVIVVNEKVGLGESGEIVNVRDGYARNFLMPRKLVIEATQENIKTWNIVRKQKNKKLLKVKEDMQKIADKLNEKEIKITVESGATGKLFGSISNHNVASYIKEQFDVDIDRHRIILPHKHIKDVGQYTVHVKLHTEVSAEMKLIIEGKIQEEDKEEGNEGEKTKKGTGRKRKTTDEKEKKAGTKKKAKEEETINEEEK